MKVETTFLYDISIRCNLCFKLQKVNKGDDTTSVFSKLHFFRKIETSFRKNGFRFHNLVFLLNLVLEITHTSGRVY